MFDEEINEALNQIEKHMDNVRNLIPGLPDDMAEDFLMAVQSAASSLDEAHEFLLEGAEIS